MANLSILSSGDIAKKLAELSPARKYKAMYSSLFGGVVTDPALMTIPIDDHMVHRGDGVFEAIRVSRAKGPYLLKDHIDRLFRSAAAIGLKVPASAEEIAQICRELPKIGGVSGDGMLRIFVSRGPGDFSPSPYSTLGAQLYILAMDFAPMPAEKYKNGVSVMVSKVPVKVMPYVQIKSCNYLQNVMMKKESLDAGYDFAIGVTPDGYLAEGPTENIAIVSRDDEFLVPNFDYCLKGTTLLRAMELAEKHLKGRSLEQGGVLGVRAADLSERDFLEAREVLMVGTTLAALGVTRFKNSDGMESKIGTGQPGMFTRELCRHLEEDIG